MPSSTNYLIQINRGQERDFSRLECGELCLIFDDQSIRFGSNDGTIHRLPTSDDLEEIRGLISNFVSHPVLISDLRDSSFENIIKLITGRNITSFSSTSETTTSDEIDGISQAYDPSNDDNKDRVVVTSGSERWYFINQNKHWEYGGIYQVSQKTGTSQYRTISQKTFTDLHDKVLQVYNQTDPINIDNNIEENRVLLFSGSSVLSGTLPTGLTFSKGCLINFIKSSLKFQILIGKTGDNTSYCYRMYHSDSWLSWHTVVSKEELESLVSEYIQVAINTHNTSLTAHADIRDKITQLELLIAGGGVANVVGYEMSSNTSSLVITQGDMKYTFGYGSANGVFYLKSATFTKSDNSVENVFESVDGGGNPSISQGYYFVKSNVTYNNPDYYYNTSGVCNVLNADNSIIDFSRSGATKERYLLSNTNDSLILASTINTKDILFSDYVRYSVDGASFRQIENRTDTCGEFVLRVKDTLKVSSSLSDKILTRETKYTFVDGVLRIDISWYDGDVTSYYWLRNIVGYSFNVPSTWNSSEGSSPTICDNDFTGCSFYKDGVGKFVIDVVDNNPYLPYQVEKQYYYNSNGQPSGSGDTNRGSVQYACGNTFYGEITKNSSYNISFGYGGHITSSTFVDALNGISNGIEYYMIDHVFFRKPKTSMLATIQPGNRAGYPIPLKAPYKPTYNMVIKIYKDAL